MSPSQLQKDCDFMRAGASRSGEDRSGTEQLVLDGELPVNEAAGLELEHAGLAAQELFRVQGSWSPGTTGCL
ncbi:MAG TPA: hypothetical protein VIY56_09155, partial [Vicinamibacterales bacterium]